MSRAIKEGDRVSIYWYDRDGQTRLRCTVLSTPSGPGDLLYVKDNEGLVRGINPYASTFEQMVKDAE